MTTTSFASIYFKVARTTRYSTYSINLNWTTQEFINIMREKVIHDFNLENVEFVDTMQNLPEGIAAEDAPALRPTNRTIRDYYGIHIYQTAFYIRPIPSFENTIAMDVEPEEQIPNLIQQRTCALCLERERNLLFTPCNHLCACTECGLNPSITVCPICRTSFNNRLVVYV
jgi:Zinc finger, C3HC4 type (RING finger)